MCSDKSMAGREKKGLLNCSGESDCGLWGVFGLKSAIFTCTEVSVHRHEQGQGKKRTVDLQQWERCQL